nr:hypothetical protein [Tanacetum cinerariifolium]
MIGCKVMRTLASVETEIMLILGLPCCLSSSVRCLESDVYPVFVDPKSSTQTDGAQSSSVPVPLPEDPYEAIRQAYLVGTDTESEPIEGEARTPESPQIVAPPTCHVEESKGSGTSGARSTSSDSTTPLSPNHPLTYTTPVLVPILCRTTRMAMRVLLVMSHGLSAGMAEMAAMSDSSFRKSDGEEDKDVEESSDSDSESEDVEDEGPTAEDEDHTIEDEGLATGVEGPNVDDESYGLDGKSHGVDDESHVIDDEIYGIDGEGRGIKIDRLGLGKEEVVHKGQQRAVLVVGTAVSEPLGLGYGALRHHALVLEEDHVYSTLEVGHGSGSAPKPERSERVSVFRQPTLTTLTDPEDASPMTTSTTIISVDEDQFIEVGAQLELYKGILQDHTQRLDAMPPTLFVKIDRDVRELYTRSRVVKDEIFSQRYRFRSLKHEQERTAVTFGALWRPVLALEAWAGRVDTRMIDMSWEGYDDHRLVYDMLLQQTALQRELQEMRDRMTVLEQEKDRRER